MAAATYNFTGDQAIEQGATWSRRFTWKDSAGVPVNFTTYTARMQIRSQRAAPDFLVELTSANGGIVLGGAAGTVDLRQTAVQTAAFAWASGVYDLELVAADGTVTRFLEGEVEVSREVTR